MRSYKNNHMDTTRFTHRTGTSTLSYGRPAQCYCRLLSIDSSRAHAYGQQLYIYLSDGSDATSKIMAHSAVYSLSRLTVFLEYPWFPVSFDLLYMCPQIMQIIATVDLWQYWLQSCTVKAKKWEVLMGGVINQGFRQGSSDKPPLSG